ncbi:hypothetical protein GF336_03735 [Candidatus Woesearchaeota archaeon]|nr:hypothetical protein [Candidatus Woesearchaeota archaeon]
MRTDYFDKRLEMLAEERDETKIFNVYQNLDYLDDSSYYHSSLLNRMQKGALQKGRKKPGKGCKKGSVIKRKIKEILGESAEYICLKSRIFDYYDAEENNFLSRNQEREIFRFMELSKYIDMENHARARNIIVLSHKNLADSISGNLAASNGLSMYDGLFWDLRGEGRLALYEAADRFELKKNTKFTTYATFWIKRFTMNLLLDSFYEFVPHSIRYNMSKVNFLMNDNPKITPEEIAKKLKMSLSMAKDVMDGKYRTKSFEKLIEEANVTELRIEDNSKTFSKIPDLREMLFDAIDETLDERKKDIIKARFCLDDQLVEKIIKKSSFNKSKSKPSLSSIGEYFNLNRERIRQLEEEALNSLYILFSRGGKCIEDYL